MDTQEVPSRKEPDRRQPLAELMYLPPIHHEILLEEVSEWLDTAEQAGILPEPFEPTKIELTDEYAHRERLEMLTKRARELLYFTRREGKKDVTRGIAEKISEVGARPKEKVRKGYVSSWAKLDDDMVSASTTFKHPKLGVVISSTVANLTRPEKNVDLTISFERRPEESSVYRINKPLENLTISDTALALYVIEATILGHAGRL